VKGATADLEAQVLSRDLFNNPYPVYEQLRERAPVYWSRGLNAWLITRYADVVGAVRDPVRFSSAGRVTAILEHLDPAQRVKIRPLEGNFAGGLINSDPPDHTRLRALVNTAFTPRVVENMRTRVQTIVNQLLDAAADRGEMDVIRDLAYPLPAIVIAEMLGVPPEDRDQFKRWADQTAAFQGTGRAEYDSVLSSQQSLLAMREYIAGLAADRRKKPREDLLSRLVAAEEQGQKLTQEELTSTCVTLLIAGHETTTSLIGHALLALMRHPAALEELKNEPPLITTAIEEFLRYESPIQRNIRRAAQEFEFGGQAMKPGQLVILMLGAANRDPRQFPNPDTLDLRRKDNRHLAFGFGIHFCVGAPLARLEAPIAINTVLKRFPKLSLTTTDLAWETKGIFRYLKSLPVHLGPVVETRLPVAA
jgi:cytochrome P450